MESHLEAPRPGRANSRVASDECTHSSTCRSCPVRMANAVDDSSRWRRSCATSWGAPIATLRGKQSAHKRFNAATAGSHVSPSPISFAIFHRLRGRHDSDAKSSLNPAAASSPSRPGIPVCSALAKAARNSIGEDPVDHHGQRTRRLSSGKLTVDRVPIPWIIGTAGWAIFFHQPFGTFDFTGPQVRSSRLQSRTPAPRYLLSSLHQIPPRSWLSMPGSPVIAEMPPLWSLGYQQSHRTLASREEVLAEAKTFREKKLPCDALIYLGTGFCPSGWNTENGSVLLESPSVSRSRQK